MQRRSKISIGNPRGKSADVENKEKYQTYNKVSVSENSEINIGTLHRPKRISINTESIKIPVTLRKIL